MDELKEPENKPQFLNLPMENVKSPLYRSIYANNTSFQSNAFDFAMIFGEIQEADEKKVTVEQGVRVIMSPLHAKVFSGVMLQNIKNYEDRFGEIKVPDGTTVLTK
jgi:uncharacterized protein DUF3467